jgi:hypothetical protein
MTRRPSDDRDQSDGPSESAIDSAIDSAIGSRGERDEREERDDDLNGPEEQTAPEVASGGPAAAAPTAVTTLIPGRRRRLVLALVLLVVGAAAVAGVVFLGGDYRQEREFKEKAEAILIQLRDGEAEKVYELASARFQQTLLIDKFLDLVEHMNATLGRFERTADVIHVDRAASVAGMTARIMLELEFENHTTVGQLSFHRGRDGKWKLLGLNVEIPPDLEAKAVALEALSGRQGAPKDVIDLVHAILEGVREGRFAEVHKEASPAFKGSVTAEGFNALLQSHRAELGNFVRVLGIISSAQSPDRDRARVQALLEYEKSKTTGTFEFLRLNRSWRLLSFKIVIGDTLPRGHAPP